MTLFLSIIAFLIIFSVVIVLHECGHFFAARRSGIKVTEFGLGIPPKIWGYKPKGSETEYTINAIPFGGFVRLYGEDLADKKALRSKRSFASKSNWQKLFVVTAGVMMNFLLAWVLLTLGFIFGIEPLYVTQQDVFDGIDQGQVVIEDGLEVLESANSTLEKGDIIIGINGESIGIGNNLSQLSEGEKVDFSVNRRGQLISVVETWSTEDGRYQVADMVFIPRVVLAGVKRNSYAYQELGLRAGDMIEKIDGRQVFSGVDLAEYAASGESIAIEYKRSASWEGIEKIDASIILTDVIRGSPAAESGLFAGDVIDAINGVQLETAADVGEALSRTKDEIVFDLERNGNPTTIYVEPDENGLAGVFLAELQTNDGLGITYFEKTIPVSLLEVKKERHPFYIAPFKALEEMWRLTVLTLGMLGNVIVSLFTSFSVPDGVAGPVGIAQLTYVFVQEGLLSLVRFAALLSLSLGIINILPFPGLDGGRGILILFSMITGKKMNQKVEGMIHVIGFLILMMLIILVTFNDIMRLFQ